MVRTTATCLTDYSKVDTVVSRYKFVNFGAKKDRLGDEDDGHVVALRERPERVLDRLHGRLCAQEEISQVTSLRSKEDQSTLCAPTLVNRLFYLQS